MVILLSDEKKPFDSSLVHESALAHVAIWHDASHNNKITVRSGHYTNSGAIFVCGVSYEPLEPLPKPHPLNSPQRRVAYDSRTLLGIDEVLSGVLPDRFCFVAQGIVLSVPVGASLATHRARLARVCYTVGEGYIQVLSGELQRRQRRSGRRLMRWLFRQDSVAWGTLMIAWGIFVNIVDNLIRPWLIGLGIDPPLSLTVLGVFGGFVTFGFFGLAARQDVCSGTTARTLIWIIDPSHCANLWPAFISQRRLSLSVSTCRPSTYYSHHRAT
jgi:hypothetical protein